MQYFNFKHFLIFSLAILFSFSSCKNDDDGIPNQDAGKGEVTANVSGSAWESSPDGPHSPVGAVGIKNTSLNIIIQAYAEDGSYISLNIISQNALSESTYTSANGEFQAQYKSDFMDQITYTSLLGQGTVTLTNISDSKVSGTFNFTGLSGTGDSRTVSNGKFDIDL
ncbi:MAG: DUF6252 family protein [Chitinophagales bacterium]